MSTSLCLDLVTWDLFLDSNGNIAVCTEPYAIAQDVACAIRTFTGDCWYDQTLGIPYFQQVLGQNTPLVLIKNLIIQEALTVPGCGAPVTVYFTNFTNRALEGQCQFFDGFGNQVVVSLSQTGGLFIIPGSTLPGPDNI